MPPPSCRASPLQKGGLSLAICLGSALLTALCLGARGAVLLSHDLMLGTNLLFPPSLHPFSPKIPFLPSATTARPVPRAGLCHGSLASFLGDLRGTKAGLRAPVSSRPRWQIPRSQSGSPSWASVPGLWGVFSWERAGKHIPSGSWVRLGAGTWRVQLPPSPSLWNSMECHFQGAQPGWERYFQGNG